LVSLCQWMPLCSADCVDFHPMLTLAKHPTRTMTAPKKKKSPQPETNSEYVHDCVVSLCHLVYCHLPNISLWHLRKFTKSQSHLQQIPPISFVLPQLCAHGALKVIKQLVTERVCSFTHSASDHPSTPPPVVPTGRFRGPWPNLLTASTAAPAARSRSTTAVKPSPAAWCSDVRPQAPKGSETSTAGGLQPVALHRPPPHLSGRGSNLWSEVREFHLFQSCIASCLNGSHYL